MASAGSSVAIALLAICSAGTLRAQQSPRVGFGRAVAETGAGFLGTSVGFVAGGLSTRWAVTQWFGASEDRASSVALAGGYVGGVLGTAAGPTIVGPGSAPRGTYWGALVGSTAGGIGSFLLVRLNRAVDLGSIPRIVSAVAVVALPAIGATIGYNATRSAARAQRP
jgi:hypothetical protein